MIKLITWVPCAWALCVSAAGWCADINTAPPQPINTPAPPAAWQVVRPPTARPIGSPRQLTAPTTAPGAAPTPAPSPASPLAPSVAPSAPSAAPPSTPPSLPRPGTLSLTEFLHHTLGRRAARPYLVMPGVTPSSLTIAGDLAELDLEDPQPLVKVVLRNLGLDLVDTSGVWVIQPLQAGEPPDALTETWIYSPRHRPIHSLLPYFQNFPQLRFTFGGAGSTASRTNGSGVSIGPNHSTLMVPASSQSNTGNWPSSEAQAWNSAAAWPMSVANGNGASASGGWNLSATATGYNWGNNTPAFTGSATAISDPSLLVVRGHPHDIQLLQAFMEKVDVPVAEVQLRVYVLEVRDQERRDNAVQLLLNLLSGQISLTVGTAPTETQRLFLGGRDVSAAISRLTTDSRVRLVSSPTLRAADGSTASVTIGTDTPTLGSIVTFSGSVQQSVSYQSAGVLLNVSPHILNDSIRLMIWQELSSFAKTETGLATTPTKLRRAFRTDVVARSGEVLMLGGLSETSQTQNRQRSWLGLGSKGAENSSSEIVVLLQVLRI